MKTIQLALLEFSELGEDAKSKAIQQFAYFNVEEDWWRFIYEDAEQIGLKITSFDIDRGAYCNGEFIVDAKATADLIVGNHGDQTGTYQTAKFFLNRLLEHEKKAPVNDQNAEQMDGFGDKFLKSLLYDYLLILRYEYDYLISEKAIIEAIEGNDFVFTTDGNKASALEKLAIVE